jgi:hypothetical protein
MDPNNQSYLYPFDSTDKNIEDLKLRPKLIIVAKGGQSLSDGPVCTREELVSLHFCGEQPLACAS